MTGQLNHEIFRRLENSGKLKELKAALATRFPNEQDQNYQIRVAIREIGESEEGWNKTSLSSDTISFYAAKIRMQLGKHFPELAAAVSSSPPIPPVPNGPRITHADVENCTPYDISDWLKNYPAQMDVLVRRAHILFSNFEGPESSLRIGISMFAARYCHPDTTKLINAFRDGDVESVINIITKGWDAYVARNPDVQKRVEEANRLKGHSR